VRRAPVFVGVAALALVLGGTADKLAVGAAAKARRQSAVFGVVEYAKRPCYTSAMESLVPLPDAQLVLARTRGAPYVGRLSPEGRFRVPLGKIRGAGPIAVEVILDGALIAVAPNAIDRPYRLKLGTVVTDRENEIKITGNGYAGAANIWTVLEEGAIAAEEASPVHLEKVWARWRDNADLDPAGDDFGEGTAYDGPQALYINGAGARRDQWEPFVLLHEYGHHVLASVASPGPSGGAEGHTFSGVYPNQPALPWSEGFADAFAAIALNDPHLVVQCSDELINMAARPATPLPDNPRLAQYNESAIAGVLWNLTTYLGHGSSIAGLKPLLGALHGFRYGGHFPESLRQVRDALITGGLETSDQTQLTFDGIFAEEKIGWGENVTVAFDDTRTDGSLAVWKIHLSLDGPYGTCQVTAADDSSQPTVGLEPLPVEVNSPGWIGAYGGLSFTKWDDCIVYGGNSQANVQGPAMPLAGLWLPFPYLASEQHLDGEFTLTARYVCADATDGIDPSDPSYPEYACTTGRSVSVSVRTGDAPAVNADNITLYRDQDVPIVKFDANGSCMIIPSGTDCSV
jgi:hypothetical protein